MTVALLAVSQEDADWYVSIYPELADAKVFMVDQPSRMEGYRVNAAHATPKARNHDGYRKAYQTMLNNYLLVNRRKAPRIL